MRKYIDSILIGVGIGSFCMLLNTIPYFGVKVFILGLLQGAGQGLIVPLIYSNRLNLAMLYKFLLHALGSYSLMIFSVQAMGLKYDLLLVTLSWISVFGLIWTYFYQRNRIEARKINKKLQQRRKLK